MRHGDFEFTGVTNLYRVVVYIQGSNIDIWLYMVPLRKTYVHTKQMHTPIPWA